MTVTDAGPLVALLDARDKYHAPCHRVLDSLSLPLLTTLPALTEAMYFLGRRFGWRGQERLWAMVTAEHLVVADTAEADLARMREFMDRYADVPMDFADASLVALLDTLHSDVIYSTDGHFAVYRLANGDAVQLVPGPVA